MTLRTILVEDNADFRELIVFKLEDRGYEVLSCSEPLTCPVYLDSECPCPRDYACADIILTDLDLPRTSGVEFIKHQMDNGCKAALSNKAVMSAGWDEESLAQAKKLDCKIFTKPEVVKELDPWLDECEKRIEPGRLLMDINLLRAGG